MKQQVSRYSTAFEMADGIDVPYVSCVGHSLASCVYVYSVYDTLIICSLESAVLFGLIIVPSNIITAEFKIILRIYSTHCLSLSAFLLFLPGHYCFCYYVHMNSTEG